MDHLLHPWHYVELLAVLPFVGMAVAALKNQAQLWLAKMKGRADDDCTERADDEEDCAERRGTGG